MTHSRYFAVLSVFYWTCGTKIILILSHKKTQGAGTAVGFYQSLRSINHYVCDKTESFYAFVCRDLKVAELFTHPL